MKGHTQRPLMSALGMDCDMSNTIKGSILVLLSALCFSISGTLQAIAPEEATPFVITEARMLVGSFFLFLWCLTTKKIPHSLSLLPVKELLFCAFCLLIGQLCFFTGMYYIGVSAGAIISIGSAPLWAAVIAKIVFKKSPHWDWYVATVMAIAGIACINGLQLNVDRMFYIFLLLMDGLTYAAYITASPKLIKSIGAEAALMFVLSLIAVALLPVLFIFPIAWTITPRGIFVCLGLGIFTAGFAFTLLSAGTRYISPSVASTLCLAEPMGAACWGIFLLNEDSSFITLSGIALIFTSIVILLIGENSREKRKH